MKCLVLVLLVFVCWIQCAFGGLGIDDSYLKAIDSTGGVELHKILFVNLRFLLNDKSLPRAKITLGKYTICGRKKFVSNPKTFSARVVTGPQFIVRRVNHIHKISHGGHKIAKYSSHHGGYGGISLDIGHYGGYGGN